MFKMKKILITGGAGFIGSNAAEYFFKRKWKRCSFLMGHVHRAEASFAVSLPLVRAVR